MIFVWPGRLGDFFLGQRGCVVFFCVERLRRFFLAKRLCEFFAGLAGYMIFLRLRGCMIFFSWAKRLLDFLEG